MYTTVKKFKTMILTYLCTMRVRKKGKGCKVNSISKFTPKTLIGNNCNFNGVKIFGNGNVMIGDNFHSGKECLVITSFHNYDNGSKIPYDDTTIDKDVIIEDNVWIGHRVIILGGVKIGEGAIVQAGSVVVKDIPCFAIAGGSPAQVFKYRDKNHYEELKRKKAFF